MAARRRFFDLSARDRFNACELGMLLLAAETSLRLRRFKSLRALMRSRPASPLKAPFEMASADSSGNLAWLVTAIDRRGPWRASCLRQSMALAWWFKRRRLPVALKIGVAKIDGGLKAHAWLQAGTDKPLCLLDDGAFLPLAASANPETAKP